jgi:hypothetical protein
MPPLQPPIPQGRCQADPRCRRTVCFQVRLRRTSGQPPAGRTADTCAHHLGVTVQAFIRRADAHGFSDGYLQVSAVGRPVRPAADGEEPALSSFPFASISLPPRPRKR